MSLLPVLRIVAEAIAIVNIHPVTEEISESTRKISRPRMLRRERDGSLFDVEMERSVSLSELAEDVKDGRRFRVTRAESGSGCTNEVLLEILRASLPDLSTTTGDLDAVGSPAGLVDQLTRLVSDRRGGPGTSAA